MDSEGRAGSGWDDLRLTAFGPAIASFGLSIFGAIVWLYAGDHNAWLVLSVATAAWFLSATLLSLGRKNFVYEGNASRWRFRFLFQLIEKLAQSRFLGRGDADESYTQFMSTAPAHRCLLDVDRRLPTRSVQDQSDLYACVDLRVGVYTAAAFREIDDHAARFAELRTGEHGVKMYRKPLVATEVHERLLWVG